jgi:hypothetical protein
MVGGRGLGRGTVASAIVAELVALAVRVAGGVRAGRVGEIGAGLDRSASGAGPGSPPRPVAQQA